MQLLFPLLVVVWCGAVLEGVGTWLFQRWAFAIGLVVLREKLDVPLPWHHLPAGRRFDSQNCCFKAVGDDTCLVRGKLTLLHPRQRRRLALKVTVRRSGAGIEATARAPAFILIFLVGWLSAWTYGAATAGNHGRVESLVFGCLGWSVVAAILVLGWRQEKRLFFESLRELAESAHW